MARQISNRREQREPTYQAGLLGSDRLGFGNALLPRVEETATTLGEPEEVMVADPRGDMSPAQMVDQKLVALLRSSCPGLFTRATPVG